MMHRTLLAGLAAVLVGATPIAAVAQSPAMVVTAKRAATRAVAATNAHTRAEQNDGTTPQPVARSDARTAAHTVAAAPAAAPAPRPAPDVPDTTRGARSSSVTERTGPGQVSLMREVFTYRVDGRRDPFVSLLNSDELRPMITDLRLVTVVFDPNGRSVAVLRDESSHDQYRVKVGQVLGRMRVARIEKQAVTFTIEEFGYSRQETLALNDSTRARSQ